MTRLVVPITFMLICLIIFLSLLWYLRKLKKEEREDRRRKEDQAYIDKLVDGP